MNNNVLACIMAYYPGEMFSDICRSIAENVTYLLVIDNSPDSSLAGQPIALPENAGIVYNKNNGAVSGALNVALALARRDGYDYLQLFDQDTEPQMQITSALIETLVENPDVVLVAPRFINLNTKKPGRVMNNISKWRIKNIWPTIDIGLVDVLFAINSASVINLKKLPANIYYDERLIIDGTDIDFCLALKQYGLQIRIDTSQCITHGIGNRADGAGRWSPTNYSAHRKHLGAKNRLMVWRRYFKDFPGFVINDCYIFILDTGRTVLLEKARFKKLWAIITGVAAGMREKKIAVRKHNEQLMLLINEIGKQ